MDTMAFMARVDLSWIHAGCPRIEQTASGFEVINFPFPKLFRPHLHASMSLGHFLLAALAKQFKQGSTIWIIKQLLLVTAKEEEKHPADLFYIIKCKYFMGIWHRILRWANINVRERNKIRVRSLLFTATYIRSS
jgi:hypothetical protein